jgi:hypothetical protein
MADRGLTQVPNFTVHPSQVYSGRESNPFNIHFVKATAIHDSRLSPHNNSTDNVILKHIKDQPKS